MSQLTGKCWFLIGCALGTFCIVIVLLALILGLRVKPPERYGGSSSSFSRSRDDLSQGTFSSTDDDVVQETSTSGEYRYAAVASNSELCSQIGTDMMGRLGGSAVDSAIASTICSGVVNPHLSGLGGGFYMTIYAVPRGESSKVLTSIVAGVKAPGAASKDMFVDQSQQSATAGLWTGVPSEVMGLYHAWQRFGRLNWETLVLPSIGLCRDGYPLTSALASAIRTEYDLIKTDLNLRELFLNKEGGMYKEGDMLTNPKLGITLERIAAAPYDFYYGALAQDVVDDILEYGGVITKDDLSNIVSHERSPLKVDLNNGQYSVYTSPPPSSGVLVQFVLNILDGYKFTHDSIKDKDSKVLTYHRIIEAIKFAFAKRGHLGDPDFVDVLSLLTNLKSKEYADLYRSQLDDDVTPVPGSDDQGTSNVSVPDYGGSAVSVLGYGGSAVSLSTSINGVFGSKVRGSRTGIIFNNEMRNFAKPGQSDDFGVPTSPSNVIEPGKMAVSTMSPLLVFNKYGDIVLSIGAAGGQNIITRSAFVMVQTLWFGTNLVKAMEEPGIPHQVVPNVLEYDPDLHQSLLDALELRGHKMVKTNVSTSAVYAAANWCSLSGDKLSPHKPCLHAASDRSQGGAPDGY